MNENTNLWNKKANDLTVGDSVKIAVITPVLVMGAMAAAGGAVSVVGRLTRKFRKSESSLDIAEQ